MLEKKPELITNYYADSIRLMPEFQQAILGKNNTIFYYKAFLARFDVNEFARKEIEVLDLGGQVIEIGKITIRMTLKSSGQELELEGTYLDLWKKQENSDLILITEAWNYDQYYEEVPELLRFEEVPAVHMAFQPNVNINNNISFQLAAFDRLLDAAVTQHNASTWSYFYADDAMLIPNYHPIYKGRTELTDYLEMHVKELPIFEELDIRSNRIDDLGDYVIEYSSHIASWRNGLSSGVGLGKNIRIWRKEPDCSLKIFRSIAMYD